MLAILLLLSISVPLSHQCLANGICGPGLGGMGGCLPQQPAMCQPACSPGYQCGPYGCARLRAKARMAQIYKPDDIYDVPKTPNQLFMECCESRNLPDQCLKHCNFNTFTKDALTRMYFKSEICPIRAAAEIQFCAAQGRDHRRCCADKGVATTLAGDKCLIFCDQRPGNVTQLDYTYLSCYDRFEEMKKCFWSDIMARSELKKMSRMTEEEILF